MKKLNLSLAINPFERIAGFQALTWGLTGMVISILLSYISGWHYHGLLHFGPASNPALWCFAVEHLVVWLIPAVLFYLGGLLLSRSKIRIVDVFGTVAFAQLPLIIMNLFEFLPPMQNLKNINPETMSPVEMMQQPGFMLGIWLSLVSSIFLIGTLVWIFNALRVSCNLKGYKLGILYCIAVFGGDAICRYLIRLCY